MDRTIAVRNATDYANAVLKMFHPYRIVMYGSHANGTQRQDSDIDVAVIFNGYHGNWLEDSAALWLLTQNISLDIEPILLDSTQDKSGFAEMIMQTGQILYSDEKP